jgi:hypothetical protein
LKIALFAPNLRGHRYFWLKTTILRSLKRDIQVDLYTCLSEVDPERLRDIGLSPKHLILEETSKALMNRWKSDVKRDKSLGVSWDGDQILLKLFFASGSYRLLILRPYLEGKNLSAITRYLVKQILITLLSLRTSIEIARLSIPYSSYGSKSFYWVRDDYNTEGFSDYAKNHQIPRELSELSSAVEIISVAGDMDVRKNPLQSYKIVEELRRTNGGEIFLVFAGLQKQSFKVEIQKIQSLKNVIQIDRKLNSHELAGLLKISVATLLVYENRGASGIALNSLVVGTPVLIQGGRNWRNLQKLSGGALQVEGKNSNQVVLHLAALLGMPRKSYSQILMR